MGVLSNLLNTVDASSTSTAASAEHHPTNFSVVGDDALEFRQYFATACPHCRHLKPAWESASNQYRGPVNWKSIECADDRWKPVEENSELCSNIPGFPTMKMFKGDKEIDEYDGGRTVDDLLAYAKSFEDTGAEVAEKSIHPALAVFASYAMNQVTSLFSIGGDCKENEKKSPSEGAEDDISVQIKQRANENKEFL